jgi:hypothetical protein
MSVSVEEIENLVSQLPSKQLKKFRAWYQEFDSNMWDKQIEQDVMSGALDDLAKKAIADHKAGKSKKL